jgi:hypothetical protein
MKLQQIGSKEGIKEPTKKNEKQSYQNKFLMIIKEIY